MADQEQYQFFISAISAGCAFVGYIRLPDNDEMLVYDGDKWVVGEPEVDPNEFDSPADVVECAVEALKDWAERDRCRSEQTRREGLRKQARSKIEAVLSEAEIEALGL